MGASFVLARVVFQFCGDNPYPSLVERKRLLYKKKGATLFYFIFVIVMECLHMRGVWTLKSSRSANALRLRLNGRGVCL